MYFLLPRNEYSLECVWESWIQDIWNIECSPGFPVSWKGNQHHLKRVVSLAHGYISGISETGINLE